MKRVEVTWRDTCGSDDWMKVADALLCKNSVIKTVGYLLSESDDLLILVRSCDITTDMVGAPIAIPKTAVVDVREI